MKVHNEMYLLYAVIEINIVILCIIKFIYLYIFTKF